MASSAVQSGPYRYTKTDVGRTLGALGTLWDYHVYSASLARIALARTALEQAIENLDPSALRADSSASNVFATAGQHLLANVASYENSKVAMFLSATWDALAVTRDHVLIGSGQVHSLQANGGGVPKPQIERATVDFSGIVGDKQKSRNHHGRPWQALCIWSREVIDSFASSGDPITYGSAGENITVSGLDWSRVLPGTSMEIGGTACTITAYAIPCSQNKAWFRDGNYNKMSHELGPVSRVYAMVTRTGEVAPGDSVKLFG